MLPFLASRWPRLCPFPCPFSRDLRGCSGHTKSNTPTNIASLGDETVDRETEATEIPMFPGYVSQNLARKRTSRLGAQGPGLITQPRSTATDCGIEPNKNNRSPPTA